jgi:CO/xanthine dehydrogenase Mo-binding subunit
VNALASVRADRRGMVPGRGSFSTALRSPTCSHAHFNRSARANSTSAAWIDRPPLGAKGVGEPGSIGLFPAMVSAMLEGLARLGGGHIEMPTDPMAVRVPARQAHRGTLPAHETEWHDRKERQ